MRGLILAEDFDFLAEETGLLGSPDECALLRRFAVDGLTVETLAGQERQPVEVIEAELQAAVEVLAAHEWPTPSELHWKELFDVMRGPGEKMPSPPTSATGYDPDHPGNPAYARVVTVKAKRLTPEDFVLKDGWRGESVVEQAQQGKAGRRRERLEKERGQDG